MSNNNNNNTASIIVTAAVAAVGLIAGAVLLLKKNNLNQNSQQQHSSGQQNTNRSNRPEAPPQLARLNDNRSRQDGPEEGPTTINCDLCEYVILSDAPRKTLNCQHSFHPICYNDFRDQMCPACMRDFY